MPLLLNPGNVRGMLLEEAVLHLLRHSGYRTIENAGSDPTLKNGSAGLEVRGRGGLHQIDAIADYTIPHPFSYPQRLLVEGKCYSNPSIGLEVIRNAVGVLKDVCEFWVPSPSEVAARKRYHYQYVVVSGTSFSKFAQQYAFAQDVYLIPLGDSAFFQPILKAINKYGRGHGALTNQYKQRTKGEHLKSLRKEIRNCLSYGDIPEIDQDIDAHHKAAIREYLNACREIDFCLLGILGERFPIFLTPSNNSIINNLNNHVRVRITWDQHGWYLNSEDGRHLFSFDLPKELFELYATEGFLSEARALDLKEQMMSVFQAIFIVNDQVRLIRFELDTNWLQNLRQRMHL